MKKPTRILIVEDMAADVDLAKHAINKALKGCEFQVVETRKEFLEALETFQPDVILSDYSLPSFDGMKALKLALKHTPLTPFIIWTGSMSEDVAVDCMKAGANNYVLKENLKRLGPAVIHALEERELLVARKQAEQAFQNSEKRFRALIEHGLDSISLLTAEGTLIWESPAAFRILDYAPDQFVGHNIFELMHPQDLEWTRELYLKVLQEPGGMQRGSFRLRHSNGTWRWVEAIVTNMLNEPSVNALVVNYRDITERKQAEEALRESERKYQNLVETSHDLIWSVDEEGKVTFVNRAAKEIYGYEPEELIGHSFFEVMDPQYYQPENLKELQKAVINTAGFKEIESYIRHRDGRQFILSSNSVVERDEAGNLIGISGSSHDITARKQAEEALKEERNLLRTLIDNLPDRIFVIDAQGRKTLSNTADWKAAGRKRMEDAIGKTGFDMYPPELAEHFWQIDEAVIASGRPLINYEEPGLDAEGNPVSILMSKIPFRDVEGNVIGLVGIGRDITERKQVEAKLQASESRYRLATQATKDVIWEWNADTNQLIWSENAQPVLGYSPEEVGPEANWWNERIHPHDRERVVSKLNRLTMNMGSESDWSDEYRFLLKDGSYACIDDHAYVERDLTGRIIRMMGAMSNITQRKEAEARIDDLLVFNEKILNHSSVGILTFKLTGECVYANENAASIIGATVEQLQAQNFHTIEAWKKSGLYDLVQKTIATQIPVTTDIHHVSTFGKDIWMTVHCVTFKLKDEEHVLLSIADITERKQAEEKLRGSENRLVMALSGAQMSVWEWDIQTSSILWSPEFFEITGLEQDQFSGTFDSFTNLIHQDDVARVMASAKRAIAEQTLFAEEFRIIRPDGAVRWLSNLGHAEYDSDGTHLRLIGTVQDVTARKQAEMERQALFEITQGFADTQDVQELLKIVHRAIAKVIYAENFFVVLYQPNTGLFEEIYSVDQYDPPAPPAKLEKSITSYVFRSGQPLLLTQVLFDELVKEGELQLVGTNSLSWLGVPLKTAERTIGVIAVQDYENDNRYSEREKDFLASIATQVALAIERREAGIALKESEERYRAVFEGVQDAIFVESMNGKVLAVNDRACEMFGYSQAEFLTKTVTDIVPEGQLVLTANLPLSAEPRETINRRANGEMFPIEISGRVQVINGETVLLAVVRDITERKKAEEALRESEERLRQIASSLREVIWLRDAQTREVLYVNPAFEELTGQTCESFYKNPDIVVNAIHPGDKDEVIKALNQRSEGVLYNKEHRIIHPDGSVRWVSSRSFPVRNEAGEVFRWTSIMEDITERKHAEQALQESITQVRTLFEASPDAIMLLDPRDNWPILDCNTAACQMNGYTRDELIGQSVDVLNAASNDPSGRAEYLERVRQTEILRYETFHRRKDGIVFPIEVSTSMISLSGREVILGIDRDITERKQAEEMLRESKNRAKALLDALPDMMFRLDSQGTFLDYKAESSELYYQSPSPLIGKKNRDIAPAEFADLIEQYIQRTLNSREMQIFEYQLPAQGQRLRDFEARMIASGEDEVIAVVRDITERKQFEKELRTSKERYQNLFQNLLDGFALHEIITDDQGKPVDYTFLEINPAFEKLTGLQAQDVLGRRASEVLPGIENERFVPIYGQVALTGQPAHFEEYSAAIGKYFEINAYSPGYHQFAVIFVDITERKQAEEEIRHRAKETTSLLETSLALTNLELEATLQTIGNSAKSLFVADGCRIFLMEPDGQFLRCVLVLQENFAVFSNLRIKVGEGITGTVAASGRAEIVNEMQNDPRSVQVPGTPEREEEAIMFSPLKERGHTIGVLSIRRAGGTRPFQPADLQLLEAFASMAASAVSKARLFEETQQRLAELRASEERFRQLADNIQEVFWMIDAESGREIYMSPAAEVVWGRPIEDLMNEPSAFINSVFSEDKTAVLNAIAKEKSGKKVEIEYRILQPNGSLRWVWDRAFPIFDDSGKVNRIAGISADITERKSNEAETRRHMVELEALYENGLAVGRLLKPSEIGQKVIETFARYFHWHHVTIRLRWEESDDLELVAFNLPDLKEEERPDAAKHFVSRINKVGQGLSGWVIQTGMPLRTGNVYAYPQYIDTHAGIQSGLYMPLRVGERIIGVISVESETPNAFTEQDERLLGTLANQAAIAFENARLYETIQKELSERKRAEEALRTSETHYRELADSITDVLFELDQNLHYTHWNKASEMLMGIPTVEAIGKSMQEIFGETDEQIRIGHIYEDVLKNHQPRTFETTMVRIGQRRSFEINAYPSTRGVSVVAKDVTERKRSEIIMQKRFELMEYSAHHSLPELMQRTVDEVSELTGSTVGFFHFIEEDQNTLSMQTWSTNALRLFQVPVREGAHLPLDKAGVWAEAVHQRRPLIQNDYQSLSIKKDLPQGHIPIQREIVIPIIRNERIMAVMGIGNNPQNYTHDDLEIAERLADYAWDIIERKQMEEALAEERIQLAKRVNERTADLSRANSNLARALRVKDEFLANMSHELRTPLNAILGLSESLGEQIAGPLNEKQQKYITTISESGHHLLSLINDILDLAKIDAGQITLDIHKVDIHSVCQASLRMIKQLAQKKNQEVVLEIDEGLGLMWADERRLKQMIVNLLGNAVKFTPENGKLGLEVHGDQEANKITFTVWDNGIGIKEGDLERLFQPFVQLDSGLAREATGTGLGLALVAQMARLHGGSVHANSESEKGSRFSIVLPWEPALALDPASRMKITGKFRAIKPDETNKPTILLVEDTKEVVMMIKDYLELAGYKVVTAQDGEDAIVQAKLVRPDLILMDVMMPRMDGFEATRKLRSEPDFVYTPIIALTALAMPNDRERCLAAGMNEYISKPVNLKALVKMIQSCLFDEESKPQ